MREGLTNSKVLAYFRKNCRSYKASLKSILQARKYVPFYQDLIFAKYSKKAELP
jgi:hypothetical protein